LAQVKHLIVARFTQSSQPAAAATCRCVVAMWSQSDSVPGAGPLRRCEGVGDGVDGLLSCVRDEVPVRVDCDRQLRMPQRLRHHREPNSRADHQGCGEMTQVVHPDPGKAYGVAQLVKVAEDALGAERLAVGAAEDEVGLEMAGRLPSGLVLECVDHPGRQADPGMAGLRLRCRHDRRRIADVGQRVADEQHGLVEVDICPVQGEGFAFPEPGADDQFIEVGERIVDLRAVMEECGGLRRGPARTSALRWPGGAARIWPGCAGGGGVSPRR
jgi:hypothetical protein